MSTIQETKIEGFAATKYYREYLVFEEIRSDLLDEVMDISSDEDDVKPIEIIFPTRKK